MGVFAHAGRFFHQAGCIFVCAWWSGFSLLGNRRPGYQGTHASSL
jgi:hypothetical protein